MNKPHQKLKNSNMYMFMYIRKMCNFLELLALLNCVSYRLHRPPDQGAHWMFNAASGVSAGGSMGTGGGSAALRSLL